MSTILVVQPDAPQARTLHDVAKRVGAELLVVDSVARAVESIGRAIPDLILLSGFLSPRDEDTLMARLRSLDGASHLQTLAIPQFQSAEKREKRSAFGLRKKKKDAAQVGVDPAAFADEVATLLTRAQEIRSRPAPAKVDVSRTGTSGARAGPGSATSKGGWNSPVTSEPAAAPKAKAGSWDWSGASVPRANAVDEMPSAVFDETLSAGFDETPSPIIEEAPSAIVDETSVSAFEPAEPAATDSTFTLDPSALFRDDESVPPAAPEQVFDLSAFDTAFADLPTVTGAQPSKPASAIEDELDQLVRQLGLDVRHMQVEVDEDPAPAVIAEPAPPADDPFDFAASLDRARREADQRDAAEEARTHIDADTIRERALAEARAVAEKEAREASAAEMARVKAHAESLREATLAEARATAEREARASREASAAEMARVQAQAESLREAALAEARATAEREARASREASAAEMARVQAHAESLREAALAEVRATAEREARASREASAAEMARVHAHAESLREAALAEARATAEREARASREASAAEMARVKAHAESLHEAAIAEARATAKREARQAREANAAEMARVQAEAESLRQAALAEAKAVAERQAREAREANAAEIARVQAEAERIREAAIAEARAAAEREAREALTIDLMRMQAEAEALRDRAITDARAVAEREAREALAADLHRVQSEAEAMSEKAIAEARAAAEREARDLLEAEVSRVRSETESRFTDTLKKLKTEAEEAQRLRTEAQKLNTDAQQKFAQELTKVRADVEKSLAAQLDVARAESEKARAVGAQALRERAAAEAQLKAELDRVKLIAAQAREADASEAKRAAQQVKRLEAELATVRAKTEERQAAELEELRVQILEMREAAAQHARSAAAEAVAAEVARATTPVSMPPVSTSPHASIAAVAPRPTAVIAQFPTRDSVRYQEDDVEAFIERTGTDRDYLSLWQAKAGGPSPVPVAESEEEDEDDAPPAIEKLIALFQEIDYKKHAKWVLPAAAFLLLVANIGAAIDTVKNLVKPAKPALTVEPVKIDEPFVEVIERRVGRLKLESTPSGAEAIVDGKSYGKTPLTVPDLEIGTHTLVLKSSGGSISRRVTIKANQVTLVTEAIYSGWLAIFSPIAVSVRVDGRPVTLSDDNRIMISPGKHTVEMISERFNYRETQTLEVLPGETTAHTMTAPMGNVRITAPEGTELRIDGEVPAGVPGEGIAIPIGAHEITARHPVHGERRLAVDVRHGGLNEVVVLY